MFFAEGFSEIAFANFSLLGLDGFRLSASDHGLVLSGQLSALDICRSRSVDLYVVPGCSVENSYQRGECTGMSSLHFVLPLSPQVSDSQLEIRRK